MKKVNTYSAQYKIIPEPPNQNQNQNHPNKNPAGESWRASHKRKLSKDRQEFINNIAASGFKQFNLSLRYICRKIGFYHLV